MQYLDLDLLENPYGKRIGGGYDTVRVGGGGRLHIRGKDGGPLCMQGRTQTDLRASSGRVVDCYRCIKILAMESNAPYIRRELTTARGVKKSHFMVPGGRQGQLVADKKTSPAGMDGVPTFKRGPTNHPTQPWMTKRTAMAKSYPERLSEEGVALPVGYVPPTFAEEVDVFYFESPKAKRRAAADRRRAAAAAAEAVANPAHGKHGLPYMTFGNPGRSQPSKGAVTLTSDMREVAQYIFASGQAHSMKEAYEKLEAQDPRLVDEDGNKILYYVDYNPRTRRTEVSWASPTAMHYANMKAGWYNNPRRASFKYILPVRSALINLGVDLHRVGWTEADIANDPEGFLSDAASYAREGMRSLDRPGRRKRADADAVHRLEEALAAAGVSVAPTKTRKARR